MRLLTWNSQNELSLTDDLDENIPTYAILSHTWGSDREEVTFADIQNGQGKSKVGYEKLRFCGEQARKDKISHFWVDTCCINKDSLSELSQAITSMFRWYANAKKCYVYLPDVEIKGSQNGISWELDFRRSRWFTRGWTLQELLAPKIVEFFSRNSDFLGTKQTLAQLIHEVTTLPLAALFGTPLDQFPIAEKIRWTENRQTKKIEDGAYCLLGIFNVFMPLIYGEGINAICRLKEEINKRFGSDVASRLDVVNEARSVGVRQKSVPLNDIDDLDGQAAEFDLRAQVSRPDELRPAKRARTSYNMNTSELTDGRSSCDTTLYTSHTGIAGSHMQQSGPDFPHSSRIASKDHYNVLVKSLLFNRIDFRVNNVKKGLLSTCEWLFDHSDFQTWYESGPFDQHNGFLWIKGKPGCGKSTLMKAALEWLRKRKTRKHARQIIVPYFFNARASASLEKSSIGLYRTVVHHLLSSYSKLRPLFAEIFALKDPGQSGENWTVEELQEFLYETIELNESFGLCLLIDALDEAEYEDDVRQMISFLVQFSDRASAHGSSCKLQVCLSSRHYPHISINRGLSLVVEDQIEQVRDIETYITKELTCLDGPEKDDLRAEILEKSARIFLWVVLVVQILNKLDDHGETLLNMKARLKTIPAGLNELFQEILMKNSSRIETSIVFFQWMLFQMRSREPLQPAELFVAMEYSEPSNDPIRIVPTNISMPDTDRLARFILNCSRGLAEVVEATPSQKATVQFIHETVREFLLKENGLASISRMLADNVAGISHEMLRAACLRCILMNEIPKEYEAYCKASHKNNDSLNIFKSDMRLKHPFLDYAIFHLFDHAEQAQKHGISQEAFLKSQIGLDGRWLDSNRLWWNVFERYKSKKVNYPMTLMHFLAERKYLSLLSVLLSVSNIVHTVLQDQGSLLQMVSYHGSGEIAQMLLDKGADVNARGGCYGSALQAASAYGHLNVVHILLDGGADVNAEGGRYGNALQAASKRGHDEVLRVLLNRNADINARGGRGLQRALCKASERGYEKVVEVLLDRGLDANTRGDFDNVLQAAARGGHEKVVRMLLDRGADINAQGGVYGSALRAASARGREKIVEMLLDQGADINAQGGDRGNALQAASASGREKIVQILLDRGADVNAQGGNYGNALQAASANGHGWIVQILLDRGADINAQGGKYGNALQAASANGLGRIVQILLDRGADVNAPGGKYGNALQAASDNYHDNVVQMLREYA